MQDYQKKVGRKHKISPRSKRTRSRCKYTEESVPDDNINKLVTMAEEKPNEDLNNLSPMDRLEKMMNNMCRQMSEVQSQMNIIQTDVSEIKTKQTEQYNDLTGKLADCQKENAELKVHLSAAIDRIDAREQCYRKSYATREKENK